ncbi:uncharacterized protein LOC113229996 [Hyposmocoma kahamanoa]|uniref:uncharacterized protein LOC113229996 n=1 Tax=Hyposmocoma kahamanoa TaxID=1477025 RepID=UPI000E6D93ED|nr:uncharacterized protein LOC113229996 [Hyposmocoma kahamanoa]
MLLNSGHAVKTWVDTKIKSSREAFLEGLTTGLQNPVGKGKRLIISHVGSEEGFVDDGLLILESKKKTEDYHDEMNSEHFEEWLRGILPRLKENSVLVLDNAPYHSRKLEQTPSSAWRKSNIQEWMKSKNITFEDSMVKAELLEIVNKEKSNYQQLAVEKLAAEHGVTILRLPPYHCELNPIELVWAQVKGHVARNNKTFKMNEVRQLFEEGLQLVTPQRWSDCVRHIIKEENKMMQLDHLIDDVSDTFIINVTDSDSSTSSGSE